MLSEVLVNEYAFDMWEYTLYVCEKPSLGVTTTTIDILPTRYSHAVLYGDNQIKLLPSESLCHKYIDAIKEEAQILRITKRVT